VAMLTAFAPLNKMMLTEQMQFSL